MLRLLIFDPPGDRVRAWTKAFEKSGMKLHQCGDAEALLAEFDAGGADAVIVEIAEDLADPAALCGRLRARLCATPMLLRLHAYSDAMRFAAIGAGADEVLPASAPISLVLAALQARMRRAAQGVIPTAPAAAVEIRSGRLPRAAFLEQLAGRMRNPGVPAAALISLRLDEAEALEEQLGFAAKVALEQQFAERFSGLLDADDAFSLWLDFGFGILTRPQDSKHLERLAKALCAAIADTPFMIADAPRRLTASAGVARCPSGHGEGHPDRWFASAHAAQSIARRLGGNRFDGVLADEPSDMPVERVLIIRERVREAAGGRNIEIEFQPMMPILGDVEPMYALLTRLRDYRAPPHGVARDEYLAMARAGGAMTLIDRISLFRAFEAIDAQPDGAVDLRVLVPLDLQSVDKTQQAWLNAELGRRRKAARRLALEFDLAEASRRRGLDKAFASLRGIGVRLCLDASTVGLTGIDAAMDLPVDLLRIPLPRIASIPRDRFLEITGPWREAGRQLIVDGIDTVADLTPLWDKAVAYAQGLAVAAPGPRLDFDFQR